MTTLTLYDRPAQGTGARLSLEGIQRGWRRTKRAIGGYHTGQFSIQNTNIQQLTDYYNSWIGMKIVERTYGIVSYEGVIWQLDLIKNGVNYRRTLDPRYWHNRVRVLWTDITGRQQDTGYSENTSSSDIYGQMDYTYTLGISSAAGASAWQSNRLTAYAWPKSRTIGGVDVSSSSPSSLNDGLYVTTAGFYSTMNWIEYTLSYTLDASALMIVLAAVSEFVTMGRYTTNTTSITVDGVSIPVRLGDILIDVINHGDASGNIWKAGVYANQELIYEPVPTTVDYILRKGVLFDNAGVPVNPALINPGFYVLDTSAVSRGQPAGTANTFDDPRVSYCDEVEFIWPNILRLKFPGEGVSAEAFTSTAPPYPFNLTRDSWMARDSWLKNKYYWQP